MRSLPTFIILSLCVLNIASAQVDMGEVVVVTDAEGGQQFPDVAYNSRDNIYLVVWEQVIINEDFEIHGILLNGDTAQPIDQPAVYLMDPTAGYHAPEVAYNSIDNEFALIARHRVSNMVVLQRISASGVPVGDPVEIGASHGPNFDPAARARVVSIAHNATDNQYLIALMTNEQPSPQIVEADGALDIPVIPFSQGTNPAVAWSSMSNVYLMAWEDRENRNTGAENLSAALISASGDLMGDILFIRDQEFAEESPRIAYNPDDDEFLVIWDERIGFMEGSDTQTDVFGQIVGANGQTIGQPIPIEFTTGYSLRQDVDYSSQSGQYLVVWKGDASGEWAYANIYGRLINRDGSLAGDTFLIFNGGDDATDEGNSEQYFDESKLPVVAANTNTGDFLVVWEEAGTTRDPEARDINARLISAMTTMLRDWELF